VELGQYVRGLPVGAYRVDGPSLTLVVTFPRPRLTGVERSNESETARAWTGCLQSLPVQHAVLRIDGGEGSVVRVVDVPAQQVEQARIERFVSASVMANGQTESEIDAVIRWRQEQVERLATGRGGRREEVDDGSLA
jgi:hypothetical protein